MVIWLLGLFIWGTSGLHFYLQEKHEKCFMIDVPGGAVVLGIYNLLDPPSESQPTEGVIIKVYDTKKNIMLERLAREKGKFSFTTSERGQHRTCMIPTSSSWFSNKKVRFELSLENTHEEVSHEHLAQKEHITHLQEIVNGVNDRLGDIVKMQEYSREKEAEFKDESEEINSRIMYFTIFQTLIIAGSGAWQIWSLRNFFISRKILT